MADDASASPFGRWMWRTLGGLRGISSAGGAYPTNPAEHSGSTPRSSSQPPSAASAGAKHRRRPAASGAAAAVGGQRAGGQRAGGQRAGGGKRIQRPPRTRAKRRHKLLHRYDRLQQSVINQLDSITIDPRVVVTIVSHLLPSELRTPCAQMLGDDLPCATSLSQTACQLQVINVASVVSQCRDPCVAVVFNKQASVATLKTAHRWSPQVSAGSFLAECQQLAADARLARSESGLCECDATLSSRWNELACNDYTGGASWGTKTSVPELPPRGRHLPPPARSGVSPDPSGLPPRVVVLTYANAPSKGLCNLLQSTIHSQVPLTVLGWEPSSTLRAGMWYIQSKFLAAALHVERLRLPPRTPVVVIDSADMMVQGDPLAIAAAAEELLKRAPLVFGAEAYCVPCTKAEEKAQKDRSDEASLAYRFKTYEEPIFHFLNGGALLTRAGTIRSVIEEYVRTAEDEETKFVQQQKVFFFSFLSPTHFPRMSGPIFRTHLRHSFAAEEAGAQQGQVAAQVSRQVLEQVFGQVWEALRASTV